MTRSIRWSLGFFNWLRKQKRVVKRVPQGSGGRNVALQMGYNACNNYDSLVGHGNIAGSDQCYANYAIQMGQAGRTVEVNDGQWGGGQNSLNISNLQNSGLAAQGALTHNGSFKYFKWDTAQGCMVEVVVSTPFVARFARSFDAFLRSWRLE